MYSYSLYVKALELSHLFFTDRSIFLFAAPCISNIQLYLGINIYSANNADTRCEVAISTINILRICNLHVLILLSSSN